MKLESLSYKNVGVFFRLNKIHECCQFKRWNTDNILKFMKVALHKESVLFWNWNSFLPQNTPLKNIFTTYLKVLNISDILILFIQWHFCPLVSPNVLCVWLTPRNSCVLCQEMQLIISNNFEGQSFAHIYSSSPT